MSENDVKVVILAGGRGSRLAEETSIRPKPMVEIGGLPIMWHIMQIYWAHGHREFLVAAGYKGNVIKSWFSDFHLHQADLFVDVSTGKRRYENPKSPDWNVGIIDTGDATMTGGRIKRLAPWLSDTFMCTYGDGVGNVDVKALLEFHRSHGKIATVTAVHPPARFGALSLQGQAVVDFSEKPQTTQGWINGGYFVFEKAVLDYIDGDDTVFERQPMERLSADGELMAFQHDGFWQPMDTIREKQILEQYWQTGNAPWKIWS